MVCVRSFAAACFAGWLLALTAYPSASPAAEETQSPQILFTNVNIFDGESDELAEGMSVLVEGNLINKIAKGNIGARDDATVIDGGGRTLMPGLIDSHSHLNMNAPGGVKAQEGMRWDEIASRAAAQAQE